METIWNGKQNYGMNMERKWNETNGMEKEWCGRDMEIHWNGNRTDMELERKRHGKQTQWNGMELVIEWNLSDNGN